ncbi:uncharacterized protein LOC111617279, partial [Centruroides sculpturatus]|uniref:uncharacterized protein LOC111617279 n=1 Tax=Centruroides sculpturatus TaxID=218467 RepID=UPI000C6D389B
MLIFRYFTILFIIFYQNLTKKLPNYNSKNLENATRSQCTNLQNIEEVIPVLIMTEKNETILLPCKVCSENETYSSRVWKKEDFSGSLNKVKTDLHDDDDTNRIIVNENHELIIKNITVDDVGFYFCYDLDSNYTKLKYLVDILNEDNVKLAYLNTTAVFNLTAAAIPYLEPCQHKKSIHYLKNYECTYKWESWGPCDRCLSIGERRRIGRCRLRMKIKITKVILLENKDVDKTIDYFLPVFSAGCHSYIFDNDESAKKIFEKIPNIIVKDRCQTNC